MCFKLLFSICYTTLTLMNYLKIYKTYLVNSFIVQVEVFNMVVDVAVMVIDLVLW